MPILLYLIKARQTISLDTSSLYSVLNHRLGLKATMNKDF
jgi:hypothetical protein